MKIHFLDKTGDTEVDVEQDVDLAKQLFTEAIANGKFAYAVTPSGNFAVTEFDEIPLDTEKVIVRPNYIGG